MSDFPFPSGWRQTTVGALAEFVNGYPFKPSDWTTSGVPIIRIAQMTNPGIAWDYTTTRVPERHRVENGDLLFSWSATLLAMIWGRGNAWLNQHIFKVVPKGNEKLLFVHHLLNALVEKFEAQAHGTTMQHIKRSELIPFPVSVPPPSEQTRIAEILDTLDAAIREAEEVIGKLRQVKAGLLHDLLTRGLDENGQLRDPLRHPDQFQPSPLGVIPKAWNIRKVGDACSSVVDCPHTTPTFRNDGVLVARTMHIKQGRFDEMGASRVSEFEYLERISRLEPRPGDVIFTREAPVGEAFVIPEGMRVCLGQRVMLLRPNVAFLNPDYLVAQIYSGVVNRNIKILTGGTTNPHLNVAEVRRLDLPLPPLIEQEAIIKSLVGTEARLEAEQQSVTKLQQLKRGLSHDLLTGRVRVKV